jgi:hypothetical protein
MAQQPGWSSNIDKVVKRMEGDAIRSGLKAAGVRLHMIIQRELDWGYTSGDFSTGRIAGTLIRGRPGTRRIWVGTPNPIAALWELGHFNRFSQRYERVEVFRKALEGNAHQLAQIFAYRYYEKLSEVAHKKLLPALAAEA